MNSSLRLFGIDLALERVPSARLIKCFIMWLAEQHCEAHRFVVAQGPDGGVERKRCIAASPAILAGRDAADTADVDLAPVPNGVPEIDAEKIILDIEVLARDYSNAGAPSRSSSNDVREVASPREYLLTARR